MTAPTPSQNPEPETSEETGQNSARPPSRDPLHGVTLERLLNELVEHFGWEALSQRLPIRCFTMNPSVKSSLTFLRKNPWAREKVEGMYLYLLRERARQARRKEK